MKVVFILLEPISFEKNFYRLPFTPPSLVRRFGPSLVLLTGLIDVSPLWDLSQVNCLVRVSLGCVVVGQFLGSLELLC
jgi:hypothetical protein